MHLDIKNISDAEALAAFMEIVSDIALESLIQEEKDKKTEKQQCLNIHKCL